LQKKVEKTEHLKLSLIDEQKKKF